MSLETSAAIIAVSVAVLALICIGVLVAVVLLIQRVMKLVEAIHRQTTPILETARQTAETVRDIGESARLQVRRIERFGDRIAQVGATYAALSRGVVVAMATLLKRRGV